MKKIDGLDVIKGLQFFGGNEDIYLDTLKSFTVSNQPFFKYAKEEIRADDLKGYAIAAHGMKGSCRLVCVDEIARKAGKLEDSAEAGDYAFVREHTPVFIETLEKLIADIKDTFAKIDAENPKPKKEKPDPGVLIKLHRACKEYDMDGVDGALAELARYEYTSDETLVKWITEKIYQLKLTEIVQRVSGMTNGGVL